MLVRARESLRFDPGPTLRQLPFRASVVQPADSSRKQMHDGNTMTAVNAAQLDPTDAPPNLAPAPDSAADSFPLGNRGRVEAAALMWNWRDGGKTDETDRAAALRNKGIGQAVVGYIAAGVIFWLGIAILPFIVATIASITLLTALFSPLGAYAAIEGGLTKFAMWFGGIVSWLVLMPVFLLFFVPFGLLFRRGERDPMKRVFVPSAPSYWKERERDEDVAGRRKSQF